MSLELVSDVSLTRYKEPSVERHSPVVCLMYLKIERLSTFKSLCILKGESLVNNSAVIPRRVHVIEITTYEGNSFITGSSWCGNEPATSSLLGDVDECGRTGLIASTGTSKQLAVGYVDNE